MFRRLIVEEAGQDLAEYALLLAVIVVIAAAALPYNASAIAAVCSKTQLNLDRALHTTR